MSQKNLIFNILLLTFPVYGKVESCPTVSEVRVGKFDGWHLVNANSNSPATQKHIEKFMRHTQTFYQAEHFDDGLYKAHCYYSDFQEVYLAKNLPSPDTASQGNWNKTQGRWRCISSWVEACPFSQNQG